MTTSNVPSQDTRPKMPFAPGRTMKIVSKTNPDGAAETPIRTIGDSRAWQARIRTHRRRRLSRVLMALLMTFGPAVLAALYVYVWATPLYISETKFAVRAGEMGQGSGGNAMSSVVSAGAGLVGLADGFAVRDFLQSRSALEALEGKAGYVKRMQLDVDDPLVRLEADANRDKIFDYYKKMVKVRFSMVEQVVEVETYAFSPQDAKTIGDGVLAISDDFADHLNQRARDDALKLSEEQLKRAEQRVAEARRAVAEWRQKNVNIDPTTNAAMINQIIGQLEGQLTEARAQLQETNSLSRSNPRRQVIEERIAAIEVQIEDSRKRLAGVDDSVAEQIGAFEILKAEQEFAEKNLIETQKSLEEARFNTLRQMRYVVTIASPNEPVMAGYPNPVSFIGGAFLAGLAGFFLISLTSGLVRDSIAR
jgi:capsular polysaccharide transport system permease protein